ncbi:MAG: U32 family peptidase [Bacilli bacterium]|nr:U32 family peptidase [Mycoplasmatota bacterium]MDY4236978.1 U32 family peptidase [Bacilli bacterium]
MEKIELMAPAGDIEKLKIALLYGADIVYIGGKKYSLRANASNFTIEDIKSSCIFAHKLGKKVYVTVNILFHDEDLEGVKTYLKELEDSCVDAVIICDAFLIPIIKKETPKLKIVMSTQMSTSNTLSVKHFMEEKVDSIVLAREVTKKEIKEIYDETHADLEVFLHGAMCTCYSGRCVLSNYVTNRDSNRGGCAQVCRFCFDLDKKRKKNFSIATKDLNLADHIKDLIEIGVKHLKVEGRMRGTYYIATVISCYRNLIDAYYNNNWTKSNLERNLKLLSRVANRESTSQYFMKEATYKDQYYLDRMEVSNQDFLGLILDYDEKTSLATIEQRNYFKVGDKVNIFGPEKCDFDFEITEILNENDEKIEIARHPKEILKIKVPKHVTKDSMMRVQI